MSKSGVSRRGLIRGAIVLTAAGAVTAAAAQPAQAGTGTQARPAECVADLIGAA
ncbi:MAG TPA: hypothetical protein VF062_17205 [Candidatus Limnocylindrales bacterium]